MDERLLVLATTAADHDSAGLPPAPTPDASAAINTTVRSEDCTKEMCESQLTDRILEKSPRGVETFWSAYRRPHLFTGTAAKRSVFIIDQH